jgi:hypothetical protein
VLVVCKNGADANLASAPLFVVAVFGGCSIGWARLFLLGAFVV